MKTEKYLEFIIWKHQNRLKWMSSYAVECTNLVYHLVSTIQMLASNPRENVAVRSSSHLSELVVSLQPMEFLYYILILVTFLWFKSLIFHVPPNVRFTLCKVERIHSL